MGLDMPNISEGTQKWEKSNVWICSSNHSWVSWKVRKEVRQDQAIPKSYLLRKHGVLVVGATLEKTYDMLERLEWNAYIAKEYLIFKQLGITGIDDLVEYDYNTEE